MEISGRTAAIIALLFLGVVLLVPWSISYSQTMTESADQTSTQMWSDINNAVIPES